MILVKNTPNNLGVEILGDYYDFENLYDALHAIVGVENQYPAYRLSRLRILGVCYDIRHAILGDREYEFVDNGINSEIMKYKGFIAPEKNLYLKINVFWPEMLFIQMVLNDFVILYAKGNSKEHFDFLMDNKNIWDHAISNVRMLQVAVCKCIKELTTDATYKRMLSFMNSKYKEFDNFLPQYVDLLNIKFINMKDEKRLKNISIMAKRIMEQGIEYQILNEEIREAAKEYDCPVEEIRINTEYPEEYEW